MCAKFGCGPTVVSKKGGGADRQRDTAALYSRKSEVWDMSRLGDNWHEIWSVIAYSGGVDITDMLSPGLAVLWFPPHPILTRLSIFPYIVYPRSCWPCPRDLFASTPSCKIVLPLFPCTLTMHLDDRQQGGIFPDMILNFRSWVLFVCVRETIPLSGL